MNNLFVLGAAAESVLDEAMKASIQTGFDTLSATVTDVLTIAVPAAVAMIALTCGVKYALKKVKGVVSMAA